MKRFATLVPLLLVAIATFAAMPRNISMLSLQGQLKKAYSGYSAGTPLLLSQVIEVQDNASHGEVRYVININRTQYAIDRADFNRFVALQPPTTDEEFWQQVCIRERYYEHINKHGYRKILRREVNDNCTDYTTQLSQYLYPDDYLTSYVQGIFASINTPSDPGRDEALNVSVINSPEPDAYMLANGNMIISTGMLTLLDSEEELAALMVNEITHHVLDHPLDNVRREIARNHRAAFWTVVLGFTADVALQVACNNNDDTAAAIGHVAGAASLGALLSSGTVNFLGLNYQEKQDYTADRITLEWLSFKQMHPEALTSALKKIANYYIKRRQSDDIPRYTSIPRITRRFDKLPPLETPVHSRPYLKNTSDAVSVCALAYMEEKQYPQAIELVRKNINNKLATDHDYVVLVKSKMALYNTEEANNECLQLLQEAKQLSKGVTNLDVNKQEILLLLRMNKQMRAANLLHNYLRLLDIHYQESENDHEWTENEITWARQLLNKINKV
ncbi:MAG: M48 family metalloprotease [Mediterranea sp.]|jgi:predicted Zn-dependent protease|nr:M48 family metalloprotease [Mediterranea sp.]